MLALPPRGRWLSWQKWASTHPQTKTVATAEILCIGICRGRSAANDGGQVVPVKTLASSIRLHFDENDKAEITLAISMSRREAQIGVGAIKDVLASGKPLQVEIKQHRNKRSLDANGMMWSILAQMAAVLNTTKDELYLVMLDRYGVFTHIVVKPSVVERVKQEWRTVRELGGVTINGQTGIQLMCFFGSSTYDTKEFSVLLNGVISDAKEIGIDVITESEKDLLLSEWGNKDDK